MAGFDASLKKLRDSAHRNLHRALDGRRFQRIMLSLAWIAALQDESLTAAKHERRARHLAARMLSRRAKRIVSVDIDGLPASRRHRVRIDAKKLRYLAEFAAVLYPAHDARRYLRRLAAVQTVLGTLNDLTAMERTIRLATTKLAARERNTIARCAGITRHPQTGAGNRARRCLAQVREYRAVLGMSHGAFARQIPARTRPARMITWVAPGIGEVAGE